MPANATSDYARKLELFEPLRGPLILEALKWLDLPPASHGLDAGCGVGLHAEPLLKAVSPGGQITGADLSQDLLNRAQELVADRGLDHAVSFRQADLNSLPFEPESFDWIWSVDCAGYMPGNKAALINELSGMLKPGGRLALMAYSSQQLLPGYPGLEARLNATPAGQLPFGQDSVPGDHFMRLPQRFSQAGLADIKAKSFMAEFNAPLDSNIREALLELMDMRWGAARKQVSSGDWNLFSRQSRPGSKECILDRPEYYGFFTYTMFTATKPA